VCVRARVWVRFRVSSNTNAKNLQRLFSIKCFASGETIQDYIYGNGKGKVIPLQDQCGPEGG